jgi:hypothetical protein
MRQSQSMTYYTGTSNADTPPRLNVSINRANIDKNAIGYPLLSPRTNDKPCNARAAAAGQSLLGQPRPTANSTFTASAARTPVPSCRVGTKPVLRSCLSSSRGNLLLTTTTTLMTAAGEKNEEFESTNCNVSFSHMRVCEYKVTLGDNPLVLSGALLSLGWQYNPVKSVISLSGGINGGGKGALEPPSPTDR